MELQNILKGREPPTAREMYPLVWRLSLPSIMAQITSILMQYIDAAMVGSLGAKAAAAIGLVESSTWLIMGVCVAISAGFSVQVAHGVGAGNKILTQRIFKEAVITALLASLCLAVLCALLSHHIPRWLRGTPEIWENATNYFLVFSLSIPLMQLRGLAGAMLQSTGNMRLPSLLNSSMCILDIVFNALMIFPSRSVEVFGFCLWLPGADLGVLGAALGTALAELVTAVLMFGAACRSPYLRGKWDFFRALRKIPLRRHRELPFP